MSLLDFRPILARLVRGEPGALRVAPEAGERGVRGFLDFAREQGLEGWLARRLPDEDLRSLPADAPARLQSAYLEQWRNNERIMQETARLVRALAGHGLAALVLKGPLLETRFYRDSGQRGCGDIDLLVRDLGQLERADAVVRSLGYRRVSVPIFGLSGTGRFVHSFDYRSESACLDLHWTFRPHFSFSIRMERVWDAAVRQDHRGVEHRTLADPDLLLLLCLSVFTDIPYGKLRAKALLDLLMVLDACDATLDWTGFLDGRAREGTDRIVTAVLALVIGFFDAQERLPQVSAALARRGRPLAFSGAELPGRLLARPPGKLAAWLATLPARMWALSLYRARLPACLLWAMVATPVRFAVHDRRVSALASRLAP